MSKKADPIAKLAIHLREIGCRAYYRVGGKDCLLSWDCLSFAGQTGWKAVARHVLTHYARRKK